MLKGIHPAISPELLKVLAEMGHGDEIILADAHFPAHSFNDQVLRADGLKITTLLDAILPLFELDSYDDAAHHDAGCRRRFTRPDRRILLSH